MYITRHKIFSKQSRIIKEFSYNDSTFSTWQSYNQQKESSPESSIFSSVFKLDEKEWTFIIRGDRQMDREAIRTLRIESEPEKI